MRMCLLYVFDTVTALKKAIDSFIHMYNNKRLHQSLGYQTPAEVYTGIAQASNRILGKKRKATIEVLIDNKKINEKQLFAASGEGLLSSPFWGGIAGKFR